MQLLSPGSTYLTFILSLKQFNLTWTSRTSTRNMVGFFDSSKIEIVFEIVGF
ncbi:unnamed protein product [Acidithrix sp. C25]|nr:unnamed protein product [Acidithrix sp. C25]